MSAASSASRRWIEELGKRLMYTRRTSVKTKHFEALMRCSTPSRLWNLARVEIGKRLRRSSGFGVPYVLAIEPTNHCNLHCTLCPTGQGISGRARETLSFEKFRQAFDEVSRWVYVVNFQNWGEPLLAPDLPAMIRHASDQRVYTHVTTNGNYAPRVNEALVDARLDRITFAVDGASEETYQQYRVGGKLARVEANVRALVDARARAGAKRPFIEAQFLVFPHNEHEREEVEALCLSWGVDGVLIRAAVAPENADNRKEYYTWYNQKNFCPKFWYTATVNVNGGLTPCCNFFFEEDDLGNVLEEGFINAFESERFQKYRKAVAQHDYEGLHKSCKDCKVYQSEFGQGLGASDYGVTRDDPRRARPTKG